MAEPQTRLLFGRIPLYALLIVGGILTAVLLAARECRRKGLPADTAVDMALYAIPLGIIGARLYYVAFRWQDYAANPLSILYVWQGGLAIYGAVIGGALGVFLCCRTHKLSFPMAADIVAPGLVLAQALGRWGNYFNMEAYGPPVSEPSLQFFPLCVLIGGSQWHMATFFYESLWNLGCFAALLLCKKQIRRNGDLFLFYLLFYGSGRFVIEQLREDSLYFLGLRSSQWLSLILCLGASFLLMRGNLRFRRGWAFSAGALLLAVQWFLLKQALPSFMLLAAGVMLMLYALKGKALLPMAVLTGINALGIAIRAFSLLPEEGFCLLVGGLAAAVAYCGYHIVAYSLQEEAR